MTEARGIMDGVIDKIVEEVGERQQQVKKEQKTSQVKSLIEKLATMDGDEARATLSTTNQITKLRKLLYDLKKSEEAIEDPDKYGRAIQTVLGYLDELKASRSSK